jgi:hypothetical protein
MFTATDRRQWELSRWRSIFGQSQGKVTASGVTEGPLLYIKLPAGSYQIAVEIDGAWQTKRIQTSTSGQATKLRFVAKGKSG